jgi:lysine 6-dehydrogenase
VARDPATGWYVRALVLGATGVIGRRTTGELLRSSEVDEVVLLGRSEDSLVALADLFGGGDRIGIAVCDINDSSRLVAHARAVEVVVSAAGPGYVTEIPSIQACIEASTSYISINDDHDASAAALQLDAAAKEVGATIISGAGVSPGVTDLLAASAIAELDDAYEIRISLSVSSADESGAASTEQVLAALDRPAPYVSEGRLVERIAGRSGKLIYFPEPVGWIDTFRMGHPEVHMLQRMYPAIPAIEYRIGMAERAVMDVLRASARTGLASTASRRKVLLSLASPLRSVLESISSRGGGWSAIRVDVWGTKSDRNEEISLGMVDHLVNLTCLPLALASIEVGSGRASHPGVGSLAETVEIEPFLTALDERGIRAARLEPVSV